MGVGVSCPQQDFQNQICRQGPRKINCLSFHYMVLGRSFLENFFKTTLMLLQDH